MHDNVLWLVRSSQKDTESTAFSNLPTKIGEEPDFDVNIYDLFLDLTIDPAVMKMAADSLQGQGLINVTYQSGQLSPYSIYVLPAIADA